MLLSQNIPTKEEFEKFITVIERLSLFEAEHRCIRGWGLLNEAELPIPEVVNVIGWLKSTQDLKDKIKELENHISITKAAEKFLKNHTNHPYTGNCISDHYPDENCDCGYYDIKKEIDRYKDN